MGTGVNTGTGTTVTFTDSSYTCGILEINPDGKERADIDTSTLSTTGGRTKMAGDLYNPGELKLKIHHDADTPAWTLLTSPAEKIRITYPLPNPAGTVTTPAREEFMGFVKGVDGPGIMIDEKMETDVTIAVSGNISKSVAA